MARATTILFAILLVGALPLAATAPAASARGPLMERGSNATLPLLPPVPSASVSPMESGPVHVTLGVFPISGDSFVVHVKITSTVAVPDGRFTLDTPEGATVSSEDQAWSFTLADAGAVDRDIPVTVAADGTYYFNGQALANMRPGWIATGGDEVSALVVQGVASQAKVVHSPPDLVTSVKSWSEPTVVLPDPTSPRPAGTITVSGRALWLPTYSSCCNRALPLAGIRLYDAGAADIFRGSGTADASGNFRVTIDGSNGIHLKVGFTTQSSQVSEGPTTCACIYESKTGLLGFFADGSSVNVGNIVVSDHVWNVYAVETEAYEKILSSPGSDIGPVQLNYPDDSSGNFITLTSPTGSDTIKVPDFVNGQEATQFY